MRSNVMQSVLGLLGLTQIRHVRALRHGQAGPPVVRVYRQVEDEMGVLAPPMALHAVAPDVLAAAWVLLRESLIVPGPAPREVKEAVATAISRDNTCPYCATIHDNMLTVLGADDPRSRQDSDPVTEWAVGAGRFSGAPVPPEQLPQLVATVVMMEYLNRMVNVFLREVPLPPGTPGFMLRPVLRVLGRGLGRAARAPHRPGESVALLPAAAMPAELGWAAADPTLADAFARAYGAIDAGGERSVPAEVRALVRDRLAGWQGEPPGISRSWVDEPVAGLPPEQQPAGRLALLVALASYQVDDRVVADVQKRGTDDRVLVELCAWAALAAARRAGDRLAPSTVEESAAAPDRPVGS